MKKTIYIAGLITGIPAEQAQAKFLNKQKELEQKGFRVINPYAQVQSANAQIKEFQNSMLYKLVLKDVAEIKPIVDWEDCMKATLPLLMKCDEIHLLPCWNESKGATIERDLAMKLKIPIVYH